MFPVFASGRGRPPLEGTLGGGTGKAARVVGWAELGWAWTRRQHTVPKRLGGLASGFAVWMNGALGGL